MILSDLIPFLNEIGARPKKSLSQNFLIDPNITRKIVETAEIEPGDRVLEIGPGPGGLTSVLLEAGAQVYAVEKDSLFASHLIRLQTADQRLSVFEADFLEFPLSHLEAPMKVVANLPYHITAPILEKLCAFSSLFSSLTIMVQKEVADRITARSGSRETGSFTIFLQFYAKLANSFKVSAACFYPRPKVDSAVIRLDFQPQPPVDAKQFFPIVRQAFQQRRKMITSSLQKLFPVEKIRDALSESGIGITARPETLTLDQWVKLYGKLI